jgi:hypothetical protein
MDFRSSYSGAFDQGLQVFDMLAVGLQQQEQLFGQGGSGEGHHGGNIPWR